METMRGKFTLFAAHKWPLGAFIVLGVSLALLMIITNTPPGSDEILYDQDFTSLYRDTVIPEIVQMIASSGNSSGVANSEGVSAVPSEALHVVITVGFIRNFILVIGALGFFRGQLFAMDATSSPSRRLVSDGVSIFMLFCEALVIVDVLFPESSKGILLGVILGAYSLWTIARWPHSAWYAQLFWGIWAVLGCLTVGEWNLLGSPLQPALDQFPALNYGTRIRSVAFLVIGSILFIRGLQLFVNNVATRCSVWSLADFRTSNQEEQGLARAF